MGGLLWALLALVCLVAAVVVASRQGTSREQQRELVRLRRLVTNLREIAYDHRELDSSLAVIILDEIKRFQRKDLEQ